MPHDPGDHPLTLDYATPNANRNSGGGGIWRVVFFWSLLPLSALLVFVLLPSHGHPREPGNRVKCASNLRQIGQGIMLYANDHGGQFPLRLDQLIIDVDLNPEVFVCPSSADDKATGSTAQQLLADFSKPGHCSYVYLGTGQTTAVLADFIVVYEVVKNHENNGMNILYANGHVEWVGKAEAEYILKELSAGQNPPRAR